LKSAPMNVPEAMLPLLNLIVVLERRYVPNKGLIRRIDQISEINRMDEKVLLGEIYSWNSEKDIVKATPTPSKIIETMADRAGMTKKQLMDEMLVRQRILEWMVEKELFEIGDVEELVQDYYANPNKVIELVSR